MTGGSFVYVHYRGEAPALTYLLGGQVQAYFSPLPGSIEHIRAGKLRPLAVTTATRLEALPETPSVAEFVPGYESSVWNGFGAPARTSPDIVSKLNNEINAAIADPRMKARLDELGSVAIPMTPADFGKLIADDIAKWAKVIRGANIKAE
jgi:tripartite-type tricarboxylate transporter receptor subunit TctC